MSTSWHTWSGCNLSDRQKHLTCRIKQNAQKKCIKILSKERDAFLSRMSEFCSDVSFSFLLSRNEQNTTAAFSQYCVRNRLWKVRGGVKNMSDIWRKYEKLWPQEETGWCTSPSDVWTFSLYLIIWSVVMLHVIVLQMNLSEVDSQVHSVNSDT